MSEETKKGRFMKNVKTNVLYAFDEKQVLKKIHMVECDADKNLLIENISVASGEMVSVMEGLVEDKAALKAENLAQAKRLLKYEGLYGSLDSALPEAPGKKVEVPAEKPVAEVPPVPKVIAPEDLETATAIPSKKEMAATLKDMYNIEVDYKKLTVDKLQEMLEEAAVVTPEEAEGAGGLKKLLG